MKLLIVGSRSISDFDLSAYITDDVDTIISGGADGIYSLAEQYADIHHLSKYILRPRYELYGRAAPLKRNKEVTPDRSCNPTTKGHFSSLLVSNIFCYPLFLRLPHALFLHTRKTLKIQFL